MQTDVLHSARMAAELHAEEGGFRRRTRTLDSELKALRALKNMDFEEMEKVEWLKTPPYRAESTLDYTLENPSGKLWLLPCIRACYDYFNEFEFSDYCPEEYREEIRNSLLDLNKRFSLMGKFPCVRVATTYCRYGAPYRKPTFILTSLSALSLKSPCTKDNRCEQAESRWPVHPGSVQDASQQVRNHLPQGLVFDILDAFVGRNRRLGCGVFLVIDVFSGWGSFADAAGEYAKRMRDNERLLLYTNDIKRNRGKSSFGDFDVSMNSSLITLLRFALVSLQEKIDEALHAMRSTIWTTQKLHMLECKLASQFPDVENLTYHRDALLESLRIAGIAVLYHCSFPCITYSSASGATHRPSLSIRPISEMGRCHDAMLDALIKQLIDICKLKPPESSDLQAGPFKQPTSFALPPNHIGCNIKKLVEHCNMCDLKPVQEGREQDNEQGNEQGNGIGNAHPPHTPVAHGSSSTDPLPTAAATAATAATSATAATVYVGNRYGKRRADADVPTFSVDEVDAFHKLAVEPHSPSSSSEDLGNGYEDLESSDFTESQPS